MSTDKEYLDAESLDFSDDFFDEEEKSNKKIEKEEPKVTKKSSQTEKKELKKYHGRENVTSVQKKKKTDNDKAQKKLISIAEKNKKVLDILKNLDSRYSSESEYICQAIIEKYERDTTKDSKTLKESIREILEEMVGENFIIMKGSSEIQFGTATTVNSPNKEPEVTPAEEEESASLIRGALDMWDDE